jgi:hypothetical protein
MSPPLVYATQQAQVKAWTMVPGVVIENAVAAAILRGDVQLARRHGTVRGDGWRATVTRCEPRTRAKKHPRPWLVTDIEQTRGDE